MRRFVALWLPFLATDRLTRSGKPLASWRDLPLATIDRLRGGRLVMAANPAARAAGVSPGLPAADATALCPGLKTVAADPAAEAEALAGLAHWCRRWSPWTAPGRIDAESVLWIEVAGSAHLFGGERALLDDMARRFGGLGFALRAGLADTPGAAWAVARFGAESVGLLPEGAARQMLGGFPVAALRLPAATVETLRRLGLRRIADLLALPRAPLVARFGAVVARRLDQLLGHEAEALVPLAPEAPLTARLAFAEPIGHDEDVAAATTALLTAMDIQLERRGLGARTLVLTVFRVDGGILAQRVGTHRPVRRPDHLARLFAEGRAGLEAGFGIEAMILDVTAADPLGASQDDFAAAERGPPLALLLDRLTRRLGREAVFRPIPLASAWPERCCGRAGPLDADAAAGWPGRPPLRLPRPRPVTVMAEGGVPRSLNGRTLRHAEGPERIAAEWWRGESGWRDYWRVEEADGRRPWLFHRKDGWFRQGGFG